ncbi:MAG: hypothetical protein ABGZ53_24455 [Fuerstiella sp.]
MRILEAEIDLRDETRGVEKSREAVQRDEYVGRATGLSKVQDGLHSRLKNVIVDIRSLPDSAANFGKELKTIAAAVAVMDETTQILSRPETGREAIAAETEVIELLLEAKRANPKSGGGGGATPGGGGTGDTDQPALALYGTSADLQAHVEHRGVQQSTGSSANELPAEFRDGLDAFFNAVESIQ